MANPTVLAITQAGVAPSAVTPGSTITISAADIGTRGVILRVITSGTATNVTVDDPGPTPMGNAGDTSDTAVAIGSTGSKMILVPPSAVDHTADPPVATVAFSATSGVTVEAYRR